MEEQPIYTLEVNPFGQYFLLRSDGDYASECFDNRLALWGEIRSLLDQRQFEIDNVIEVMCEFLTSFLPNFPPNFTPEEGYSEVEFLREMYDQLEDFQTEAMAARLPVLPYFVECVEPKGCAFIFFEISDGEEKEKSDLYPEHSYILSSKNEAYDWLKRYAEVYKINAIEQELLKQQIYNSSIPQNEKYIPLGKEAIQSFIHELTEN